MTKDPVCGMKVDENKSQYQAQYGGKKYSFCSAGLQERSSNSSRNSTRDRR